MCLRAKGLGKTIDKFPIVIRVNRAPIIGFERDVGSRTDIRVLYPESAPKNEWMYKGWTVLLPHPVLPN